MEGIKGTGKTISLINKGDFLWSSKKGYVEKVKPKNKLQRFLNKIPLIRRIPFINRYCNPIFCGIAMESNSAVKKDVSYLISGIINIE